MADCGTLEVVSSFSKSAIQVTSCPSPDALEPEDTQTLDIAVENRNSVAASATIEVTADDEVIGSRSINISGDESREYGVEITAPSEYGSYDVSAETVDEEEDSEYTSFTRFNSFTSLPSLDEGGNAGTALTAGAGLAGLGLAAYRQR